MADEGMNNVFVVLCDWRGRVVWTSRQTDQPMIGEFSWANLTPESQENTKELFAKVASLRQAQNLLVENQDGQHFRCWLWPLDTPEIAVCVLCREVPNSLAELSDREMECMQLLSQGLPIRDIAEQLNVSTSTLHTHLSRARAKLNLESLEALISFAARFCYPPSKSLVPESKNLAS